ncbi:MAG: hypothetical protein HQK81_07475 [Desulfovibrionaceae bacterium]|nr:hypothetical protein [Desulfovibrionaceae bacterium]MBF0513890.1 hypothetical protein [Desulfovibrionaceae bacterium]
MSGIIYLRHLPADPGRDPCHGCWPGCPELCEACPDRQWIKPVQHENILKLHGDEKEAAAND